MKTKSTNKVLIALDFDPTAQKVAEIGFAFAKTMGAEITLLHVLLDKRFYSAIYEYPIMGYSGTLVSPLLPMTENESEIESKNYLDKIKQHLGEKTIKLLVKEGNFADVILETAEELGVDVIVLGSHSRRWMDEILMGSVTEKVLHHSSIPLFIIPTKKFQP